MTEKSQSALAPFKHRTFLVMWLAALISNIGTWMHSVGAGWLMTDLSPSPLMISLVQTSTSLPVFLFALPAGALADIFNRRFLLLVQNIAMLIAACLFAYSVWNGSVNAEILLLFSFVMGTGAAFMAPAWSAVVPQMVPKEDLAQAVALGGISINLSRAIGPAIAGVLISLYGIVSPFIANAFSFIAIIGALFWWRYSTPVSGHNLPPERVFSAMRTGLKYAWLSAPMRATIWHITGFMFFGNAFWGLMPIISRDQLAGGAPFFGLLMGAIGLGAVIGALILPRLKSKLSANQLVALGSAGVASITLYFGYATNQLLALGVSFAFGVSWILVLATVNVSAQQALPNWVRARGLAVFLMTFFGSMSAGAAFWGWMASYFNIETTMVAAGIGGIAFIALSYRFELQQGAKLDLTPSNHWPEPQPHDGVSFEDGPVIIQIQYKIKPENREEFVTIMYALRASRIRDGGYNWGIYEDAEHKGQFIEHFMEESWANHLRHHERVSNADRPAQERARALHEGPTPPIVNHFIATHQ